MTDLIKRLRDREFFSRTGERHELLAAADRIVVLEAALRSIANFPHTPSKNRAAKQMSLIARAALEPEK